jgi:hypothetical protein
VHSLTVHSVFIFLEGRCHAVVLWTVTNLDETGELLDLAAHYKRGLHLFPTVREVTVGEVGNLSFIEVVSARGMHLTMALTLHPRFPCHRITPQGINAQLSIASRDESVREKMRGVKLKWKFDLVSNTTAAADENCELRNTPSADASPAGERVAVADNGGAGGAVAEEEEAAPVITLTEEEQDGWPEYGSSSDEG